MCSYYSWNGPRAYFDINNIEDVIFYSYNGVEYALVLANCTFNGTVDDYTRDPYLGRGANIGVVRNPLDPAKATLIGATEEIPWGWADQLAIDPFGRFLFATFKGTNEVIYYDVQQLIQVAEAMQSDASVTGADGTNIQISLDAYARGEVNPTGYDFSQGKFVDGVFVFNAEAQAKIEKENATRKEARGLTLTKGRFTDLEKTRPSGIAASPMGPTEFVAESAVFVSTAVSDAAQDVIRFTFSVYGEEPDANTRLTAQMWWAETSQFEDDTLIPGALSYVWTIDKQYVTGGRHTVELKLSSPLGLYDDRFLIVKIDAAGNFEEQIETNNDAAFQMKTGTLVASYDGDKDPKIFGQYIRDVSVVNTFTLFVQPEEFRKTDTVRIELGGVDLGITPVRNDAAWSFTFTIDMKLLTADLTTLKYTLLSGGKTLHAEEYQIKSIAQPDWILPTSDPNQLRSIEFLPELGAYEATAVNWKDSWEGLTIASELAAKDTLVKIMVGSHLIIDFSLSKEIVYQDAGASVEITLFGYRERFDIPGTGLLFWKAINFTQPVTRKIKFDLKDKIAWMQSLQEGYESKGTFSALGKKFKTEMSLQYKPAIEVTITAKPFKVNEFFELKDGEYSLAVKFDNPIEAEYKIPFQSPSGTYFEFKLTGKVAFGFEFKLTGGAADGGKFVSDVATFTASLEGGLKISAAVYESQIVKMFGAGVEVEVKMGLTATWNLTQADIIPTVKVPLEITSVGQLTFLGDAVAVQVLKVTILKHDNLLDPAASAQWLASWEWGPEMSVTATSLLTADALEDNNHPSSATDLGVIAGTETRTGLNLADDRDIDYYRFRTIEKGGETDAVNIAFAYSDPAVNVFLLDAEGAQVALGTWTDSTHLTFSLEGLAAGEYYLGMMSGESLGVGYDLSITGPTSSAAALVASISGGPVNGTVRTGQYFDVTVSVTNAGDAASPAAESMLVWSRDGRVDFGDGNLVSPFMVPALAPGESWSSTFRVKIPAMVTGQVYVGALIDRREIVPERVRRDNEAMLPVEVTLAPDAFEYNDTAATATDLGGITTARTIPGLSLHAMADEDWFTFYLSETGTAGDQLVVERLFLEGLLLAELRDVNGVAVFDEAPGAINGVVTLSLEGLAPGRYYLRVSPVDEAAFDYTLYVQSVSRSEADLLIEDIAVPPELLPGANAVPITVSVKNLGGDAARSVTVGLVLVDVATGDEYALSPTQMIGVIGAGESVSIEFNVTVPAGSYGADLLVKAVADPAGVITELNEQNNSAEAPVVLAVNPDAEEYNEDAEGAIDLGVIRGAFTQNGRTLHSRYDLDAYLFRMMADGTATDSIEVTYSAVEGTPFVMLVDAKGGLVALGVVSSDGVTQISLDGLAAGLYRMVVRNFDGAMGYTMNVTTPDVTGSDPSMVSVSADKTMVPLSDAQVTADWTVTNFGTASSGALTIGFFLSTDDVFDVGSDIQLGVTGSVVDCAAGATLAGTTQLDLSSTVPGFYYLMAVVSPDSGVETTAKDNVAQTVVVVLPAADAYESNNSFAQATVVTLSDGHYTSPILTIHDGRDVDWFRFDLSVTGGDGDLVRVVYRDADPDLRLSLMNSEGRLVGFVDGTAGASGISLKDMTPGAYYVKVEVVEGLTSYNSGYTLYVDGVGGGSALLTEETVSTGVTETAVIFESVEDFEVSAQRLAETALDLWRSVLGDVTLPAITVTVADLPDGVLGRATVIERASDGTVLTGLITVDRDADGAGWFVDTTPETNEEFLSGKGSTALTASEGSDAWGRYDLLTFLAHEVGHLLGIDGDDARFAAHTVMMLDGSWRFVGDGLSVILTADREHLCPFTHPGDLMNPALLPSLRKLPSVLDADVVRVLMGVV